MISQSPIIRHKSLQPLSHDHHHGLLLCWKIRTGLKNHISVERIHQYCTWFYREHILPHFELEEQTIFPVLGMEHPLVLRALVEHRRLKSLFENTTDILRAIQLIETELDAHIRFEERTLFAELQKTISEVTLTRLHVLHAEPPTDNDWPDPFWEPKQSPKS